MKYQILTNFQKRAFIPFGVLVHENFQYISSNEQISVQIMIFLTKAFNEADFSGFCVFAHFLWESIPNMKSTRSLCIYPVVWN